MRSISFVLMIFTYPESKQICPPAPCGIIFIVTFIHYMKLAYQLTVIIQNKNINNTILDILRAFGYHILNIVVIK